MTCIICGKKFKKNSNNQKYCNKECSKIHREQQTKKWRKQYELDIEERQYQWSKQYSIDIKEQQYQWRKQYCIDNKK